LIVFYLLYFSVALVVVAVVVVVLVVVVVVVVVVVLVVVVVAVVVVVVVVVVVLMSISQLLPSKPSLQKHFVCLNLSAKHVPPFWHVVSVQGLFTTSFYFYLIQLYLLLF
jgi:hypothetical protein